MNHVSVAAAVKPRRVSLLEWFRPHLNGCGYTSGTNYADHHHSLTLAAINSSRPLLSRRHLNHPRFSHFNLGFPIAEILREEFFQCVLERQRSVFVAEAMALPALDD